MSREVPGWSVVYRSLPKSGVTIPADINFDDSETSAIVLLIDKNWAGIRHGLSGLGT